jgi:hypothetical protein
VVVEKVVVTCGGSFSFVYRQVIALGAPLLPLTLQTDDSANKGRPASLSPCLVFCLFGPVHEERGGRRWRVGTSKACRRSRKRSCARRVFASFFFFDVALPSPPLSHRRSTQEQAENTNTNKKKTVFNRKREE